MKKFTKPALESLETRTLLSAAMLAAGKAMFFDINGDGANDAILVNTGNSAIEYDYEGGAGLASVKLTANGGKFSTNTWVGEVGDVSATDDYSMGTVNIGTDVTYRNVFYGAIAGDSRVTEGAITQLTIGQGNLLSLNATVGGIGKVWVKEGDLASASAVGAIDSLLIAGDILGAVSAGNGINRISANRLDAAQISSGSSGINQLAVNIIDASSHIYVPSLGSLTVGTITGNSDITTVFDIGTLKAGTISGASIAAGGSITKLVADTITGSPEGTTISILQHVGTFQVQTISGGLNSMLSLSFGAGVDKFTAGSIDGGQATDGGFSGTFFSIAGTLGRMCVGSLSGGFADGAGSFAMLNFQVDDLYGTPDVPAQAGDINYFHAAAVSGGTSLNGGDAMLNFTVAHDLVEGYIGQLVGNGNIQPIKDPSVYINVGHDIVKLVVGRITAGTATGEYAYASVNITAGNDIVCLTAGGIDAGSAVGDGSMVAVYITAGRDINSITSRTFSGGQATGVNALAGVYVEAARNIDFIGANLISGTQAAIPIKDPTVHFVAGGDIGLVMAGRITGGTVTADGDAVAQSSVLIKAAGTYVDENGVQSQGNIGQIVSGMIDGGMATGATALSYVKIEAAHDIDKLYADHVFGGQSVDNGFAYVNILAHHNINDFQAGVISGETNAGLGGDPAVVIQAFNDIKNFTANRIVAGPNGKVSILAGIDDSGNVSGETDADGNLVAGSIENMVVGLISGNGGIVEIAAGGSIDNLQACRIISGDGDVDIVAGGDITANVGSVSSWSLNGANGVQFSAGGEVNDVRNSIKAEYTQEGLGGSVEFPEPSNLPE